MQKDFSGTFHDELRSFFALSVLNIGSAALTMALGIGTVVTQAGQMIPVGAYVLSPPGLLFGVIVTIVGMRCLSESARMLGGTSRALWDEVCSAEGKGDEAGLRLLIGVIGIYRIRDRSFSA